MSPLLFSLLSLGLLAAAKTVTYDWEITWVTTKPDGFERPVIGINGQWPPPTVEVDIGDRLVVQVTNNLGNQSTSLHWHGIEQRGTNTMDGSSGATQCPIPPQAKFTYDFTINQGGTFWYHSHNQGQYPDGLRGVIIVHDQNAPYADKYDEELTITLSDWYHGEMPDLIYEYQSKSNEDAGGNEPKPDSTLINDSIDTKISVKPDKTYLLHVINSGNWAGQAIQIEDHHFTLVEVDGVYTDAVEVGSKNIRIATGQRWTFLMDTKNSTDRNYAIWAGMDVNMIAPPPGYNPNGTAYLVYNDNKPLPPPLVIPSFDFFDDIVLVPADHMPLLEPVDQRIIMTTGWANIDGIQ
ncbi:MAG: hypothetical protein Q9167_007579, partial [Letrouitia subvulpina]